MTFIDTLYNARLTDKPQPIYKQKFFTKNISSDIRNIRQWSEALPTEDIKTICDLTGNVGTESIYFTRTLPNVEKTDIYEIDATTYQQLQENVGTLPKPI